MVDKTIQEQIIREAPEIEAKKLGLMDSAKTLADIAIEIPDYQIADESALTKTARTLAQPESGGIGGYEPYLTSGTTSLGTGITTLGDAETARAGSAGLFAPSDLSSYMNPYQQAVIDTTLAELTSQGHLARNKLAAQAVGAGAFGGSRFGVQGAELDRGLADIQSQAIAKLNAQNYAQALETAASAFENQQRRQQNQAQLYSGIAGLYGDLGGKQLTASELAQTLGLKDIATLQNLGAEELAYDQSVLEAERMSDKEQLYEPYSRLGFLSDIYKGAPSSQMTLGSQVAPAAPSPSAFQQVAGVGTGLLGTAAAAKQLSSGIF